MKKVEVDLCQDCILHAANGQVEWHWADDLEKEEVPSIVEGFYEELFARKGVRGYVTVGELEPDIKREVCDLCLNYDSEGEQGRPLLGEFWQCFILVDSLALEEPLAEASMGEYCSLRDDQSIEVVKVDLQLKAMDDATRAVASAAKESGRVVTIDAQEFVEVSFYDSEGLREEPLYHRVIEVLLEINGDNQAIILRTASKHDDEDWMEVVFPIQQF